jgi:hypothetical protein
MAEAMHPFVASRAGDAKAATEFAEGFMLQKTSEHKTFTNRNQ